MSEDTMITEKRIPNPQKVKWYNVAYYDNFQQADEHRKNLNGLTKVRRCGPFGTKFVVKSGTLIKEGSNE
tara:strand:- start:62 stop:271 length:210 start_codon:yes stop_codon:yes gene_type:complete